MNIIANRMSKNELCKQLNNDVLNEFQITNHGIISHTDFSVYLTIHEDKLSDITGAVEWINDYTEGLCKLTITFYIEPRNNEYILTADYTFNIDTPALISGFISPIRNKVCTLEEIQTLLNINSERVNKIINNEKFYECICDQLSEHADYHDLKDLIKDIQAHFSEYITLEADI